ncbi:hypothetical protein [Streptosporangium sp. KLBMP 9127]|nr:hypothetical protein [Streptosporangium sp. KLBMP 9127]
MSDVTRIAELVQWRRSGAARHIRRASGLNASRIARAIGVAQSAVSQRERALPAPQSPYALRYYRAAAELCFMVSDS